MTAPSQPPRASPVRWHRRLDLRLALAVLLGLMTSGLALLAWQSHDAQRQADAQWQGQSLGLARYVVERQAGRFIDAGGALRADALADTGMYIAMIHPGLEAYLVTPQGRIVSHTLGPPGPARATVDLARVGALLAASEPVLPIHGDDPRRPQGNALVSIAPVGAAGHLYLVLQGEQAARQHAERQADARRLAGMVVVAAALLMGGAVILVVQWQVTRRVRRLGGQLAAFRNAAAPGGAQRPRPGDEIDQLQVDALALQQRVQQQIHQLEDSDRQRRELISNISHDLHTPLANIRGWLDTLLIGGERLPPEERERHLRTAARHCASLGRRVAELFELAQLESARAVAHPEPFCMTDLLSDVVQAHQLEAERKGVALCLAAQADPRAWVVADVGLIERVLVNLVDNAVRHTAAGGRVELAVSVDAERVTVKVADTGHGIAQADLPHVFERYWTTRSTERDHEHRPAVSAGLGLAIVRRIVELHGGQVGVRSELRQGTEFTFTLPASLQAT